MAGVKNSKTRKKPEPDINEAAFSIIKTIDKKEEIKVTKSGKKANN